MEDEEERLAIQSFLGLEVMDSFFFFFQTKVARGRTSWWPVQDWDWTPAFRSSLLPAGADWLLCLAFLQHSSAKDPRDLCLSAFFICVF